MLMCTAEATIGLHLHMSRLMHEFMALLLPWFISPTCFAIRSYSL